jgi:hypothetical protein
MERHGGAVAERQDQARGLAFLRADGAEDTCDGEAPEVYVRIRVRFQHETLLSYPSLDNPMTLTGVSEFRLR